LKLPPRYLAQRSTTPLSFENAFDLGFYHASPLQVRAVKFQQLQIVLGVAVDPEDWVAHAVPKSVHCIANC
jgi:hypothetical protein